MNRGHKLRALSLLIASAVSSSTMAQALPADTSAKALGLSDYRHFVIYPHLEKALRAQKKNDEKTAIQEFEHAQQQVPDNVVLSLYLAEAYRHFGHDEQALRVLREQLKRHPDNQRLQQQLDAIPRKVQPVTTLAQLLAQQKNCDATPTTRCRSETGQNALKLGLLNVASAQLNDVAFAGSTEGLALENGILQRAIFLKAWQQADERFSQKHQRQPLSAAEKQQWFDVLLSGKLDNRIQMLQSQGLFTEAHYPLAFAGALATRGEIAELQRYLADHQPQFDNEAQEQNWLYLISRYGSDPLNMLQQTTPQFAANQRYVVGAVFPAAMKARNYAVAQKLLSHLPDDEMLAQRYALSTATQDHARSMYLAGLMYQRAPHDLSLLDNYSWQLMQNGQSREAMSLLLARYPYAGRSQDAEKLLVRLGGLLQRYPDRLTAAQLARLSAPLATASQRQLQSQLPVLNNDCQATRRLLGDLSEQYNVSSWDRLAQCYRHDLPGMALYAQKQADRREPDTYHHRAVAYQAYSVEEYAIALQSWKKLTVTQMSNDDLMAAANTAQSAADFAARDRWVDEAQKRGLDTSETWWWLHAQRYLPGQPSKALADLNQSIAIEPTVRALNARAALYRELNHKPQAIADLRQALVIEPNNTATQAALGYALWSNGQYVASRDVLEKAHKETPDDPQLTRQLMYVNERLGDSKQTQRYAQEVVDELNASADVGPLTTEQNQERFDVRRLHEDIGRRWTFNFDTSLGLNSGALSPFSAQQGGPPSAQSYRSFGQLEAEYRLGHNMLLDGDMLSVYTRMFAGTDNSNVVLPVKNPMLGAGLRWKPLHDYTLFLAVEEQFALDHHHGETDTMLRASASFFNSGKYSDEWHPNGRGWFAQNLYLDGAQYVRQDIQAWTADYRTSWHQKVGQHQTIEPYAHVQINGYRDGETEGAQIGGLGVRWNIWMTQTRYDAWPHKVSLGLEYQHTFKTINQDAGERNNAFLTVGVHW